MRVSILCIDTICMANDMCTYVKRDRRIDIERERRAVWASDSWLEMTCCRSTERSLTDGFGQARAYSTVEYICFEMLIPHVKVLFAFKTESLSIILLKQKTLVNYFDSQKCDSLPTCASKRLSKLAWESVSDWESRIASTPLLVAGIHAWLYRKIHTSLAVIIHQTCDYDCQRNAMWSNLKSWKRHMLS